MKAILDHVGIAVERSRRIAGVLSGRARVCSRAAEEVAVAARPGAVLSTGAASLELLAGDGARFADREDSSRSVVRACITSRCRVDDIDAALDQLRQRNVRLIDDEPRPGAEGAMVAFIHPSSAQGVLVELKQVAPRNAATPERRRRSRSATSRS